MEKKNLKKNILLLQLLNLLMDLKLYSAIVVIYFTKVTGSMALGMSILSITMISAAIFELPTGIISDKVGRKSTVILGAIFSLLYSVMFATANNYLILAVGAILEGIERAFFSGNNNALLYDLLKMNNKESEYSTYIGKTNSMYQIAGALGALMGGIIAWKFSYKVIMYLSIIPKILNIFVALKIEEPKLSTEKVENNTYKHVIEMLKIVKNNKVLRKQFIADGLSDGIGEATYQFRSKFYELVWPTWALGIPTIFSNIGRFFANWFGGKIVKKFNNKRIIIFGNIYSIISNILGVVIKNVMSPIILITNSLIPTDISQSSISQKLFEDKYRASMGSLKSLIGSIMYAIFAIVIGIIADIYGVIITLIVAQLVKTIVVAIYLNIFKTNKELI